MENNTKFVDGKSLTCWGVLDIASVRKGDKEKFVDRLYDEGKRAGLTIDYPIYTEADPRRIEDVEKEFKKLYERLDPKNVQLIMIFTDAKGPIYSHLKHLGDVVYGKPTQFVMKKNVVGRPGQGPSPQVLHNICLKLNSKLCGVNQALWNASVPRVMNWDRQSKQAHLRMVMTLRMLL